MPLIDFIISNPGHHVAMTLPVMAVLSRAGYRSRLLSLCEFRGFATPAGQFSLAEAVYPIPERQLRASSSTGRQSGLMGKPRVRRWLRTLAWWTILQWPLTRIWQAERPDLVVLPNDAAFPYDRIVKQLHARQIPFLLLQEGIRFALPGMSEDIGYGRGGAAAVAAWGESSAAYFRAQGIPDEHIYRVGNPRFDQLAETDWLQAADELRRSFSLGRDNLLFLSNPIDDQGFCTTAEKLALVGRFLRELSPLFARQESLGLVIKLHGREAAADFQPLLEDLPYAQRVTILGQVPLYALFPLSRAAVVMASTAGLEALLFEVPLAVLEIPGVGFVHDYVAEGAALGLSWKQPFASQLADLLTGTVGLPAAATAYLQRNLALSDSSGAAVAHLIERMVNEGTANESDNR